MSNSSSTFFSFEVEHPHNKRIKQHINSIFLFIENLQDQKDVVIINEEDTDLDSYLDYSINNIEKDAYDLNINLIPKKYQGDAKFQIMIKTKKENYYDLQK